MLGCYFVQLNMASWIMVLSLGTFGPAEYALIADGLVFLKRNEGVKRGK